MKFSIIIPAYNAAQYISRCLDSVIADDYPEKEVLVIDDGSPDDLEKRVAPYCRKYPWIRLIHRENGGLSAARNTGLEYSAGDYVVFLDADDFWIKAPLRRFAKIFDETGCDIIKADYVSVVGGNTIREKRVLSTPYLGKKISGKEYLRLSTENRHYEVVVCGGGFRKSFLDNNKLRFREGVKYEDHEFTLKCILANASFVQISDQFYGYFLNMASITKTPNVSSVADIIFNFRMMRKALLNFEISGGGKDCRDFCIPVAHIVYHALMVWWRLPFWVAMRSTALFQPEILNFAQTYTPDARAKKIITLFKHFPTCAYVLAKIKQILVKFKKRV